MRSIIPLMLATLVLPLAACGEKTPDKPKTQQAAKPAPAKPAGPVAPLTPAQVTQVRESISKAMDDVPPELRNDFQRLFTCETARDKAPMTAERIRDMTARLKANRGLANCKA